MPELLASYYYRRISTFMNEKSPRLHGCKEKLENVTFMWLKKKKRRHIWRIPKGMLCLKNPKISWIFEEISSISEADSEFWNMLKHQHWKLTHQKLSQTEAPFIRCHERTCIELCTRKNTFKYKSRREGQRTGEGRVWCCGGHSAIIKSQG